ncbi:MAG: DAK2 domain-containing protein [Eubacteriales bacterium]|nr:DAK2 domain-containing protein [Eubacteriales bacterium]
MNEIMQTENVQSIGAARLADLFLAGAVNLEAGKEWINELNVFPVPDGDTGTNMTLTIKSAVAEVENLDDTSRSMRDVLKAISSGSLRGARGNSGVILSQLLRGFGKVARDNDEINVEITARAFERAVETAYKAVMKPKEGTILTVAKGVADKAKELSANGVTDFAVFIPEVIAYGEEVLAKTPDMLPVLKQAGVVDSGGQGLIEFLKGCYNGFLGKEIVPAAAEQAGAEGEVSQPEVPAEPEIKYVYRTAFTIVTDKDFNKASGKSLRKYLESLGEDVICDQTDNTVEVKLNTNDPGLAIQKGILYGDLTGLVVENRKLEKEGSAQAAAAAESVPAEAPAEESSEEAEQEMPHKDIGFITVSVGDGIEEIFRGLGVDYVIAGGQTMNPSTDDILNAVNKVNADTIYILPNNKNIVMAARQAAELTEDKKVIVIPTTTIPQGITAVINFTNDLDPDANRENMLSGIELVKSAEVTYSIRDTVLDDVEIHKDDIMGIGDSGILAVGSDRDQTALDCLAKMVDEDTEIISIYYGQDVTEEDAENFKAKVVEKFDSCDVELQYGGQPIYFYILSAE